MPGGAPRPRPPTRVPSTSSPTPFVPAVPCRLSRVAGPPGQLSLHSVRLATVTDLLNRNVSPVCPRGFPGWRGSRHRRAGPAGLTAEDPGRPQPGVCPGPFDAGRGPLGRPDAPGVARPGRDPAVEQVELGPPQGL